LDSRRNVLVACRACDVLRLPELVGSYFRDVDGREVDFVVTESSQPVLMVECKWDDAELDKSLRYLHARFPTCPAWQIAATGRRDYVSPEGTRVCPALTFLGTLV
jgi:uncharacterized protein